MWIVVYVVPLADSVQRVVYVVKLVWLTEVEFALWLIEELTPVPVGPTTAVVELALYEEIGPVPVGPTTADVELALYEGIEMLAPVPVGPTTAVVELAL